jgi:hypothetical protein
MSQITAPNKFTVGRSRALLRSGHVNPDTLGVSKTVVSDNTSTALRELAKSPSDNKKVNHVVRFLNLVNASPRVVKNQVTLHHDKLQKKMGKSFLSSSLSIVPDRVRTTLRLTFTLNGSLASPTYLGLSPTDLIDVGISVSALQPIGLDEWLAFYGNFLVMRSKLKIIFGQNAVATQSASVMSCALQTVSVSTGGFDDIPSNHGAVTAAYSPGGPPGSLDFPWASHANAFGVSETEYRSQERFFGSVAVPPTDNLFWNIVDNRSVTASGYINYYIADFDVEFFNRLPLDD